MSRNNNKKKWKKKRKKIAWQHKICRIFFYFFLKLFCFPDFSRAVIIYHFLILISAFKILRYIDIVSEFDSNHVCRTLNFENLPINKDFISTFCTYTQNEYVPAFSLCNFSNKAMQMQTMKTVRHSRPTYHKSAHKILILGLIKKRRSSTESLKCARSYRRSMDAPSCDTKSWYTYPSSTFFQLYLVISVQEDLRNTKLNQSDLRALVTYLIWWSMGHGQNSEHWYK